MTNDLEAMKTDNTILTRALEVRVQDLGLVDVDGTLGLPLAAERVAEIRAGLLYDLASKKEQAHALGLQVASLRQEKVESEARAAEIATDVEQLHHLRAAAEARVDELTQHAIREHDNSTRMREELTKLDQERVSTLVFVEELRFVVGEYTAATS